MSDKTVKKASYRKFLNSAHDMGGVESVSSSYHIVRFEEYDEYGAVSGLGQPVLMSSVLDIRCGMNTVRMHFSTFDERYTLAESRKRLLQLREALDVVDQGLDAYEETLAKKSTKKS